jgi:hydroxymethylpyrimidine pyrophosphatase-like HAD family hydrolase
MPCSGEAIHAPQECEISLHLHREYSDPLPVRHEGYAAMLENTRNAGIHMIGIMTKDCRETEMKTLERVKALVAEFGPVEEFSVVLPIPRMVTLMPRNTSKGTGLLALCRSLSICPSRVAAVGDAGNDIEMIRAVGWGIAMGNAKDEVKQHAKLVVNRNDHPELPGVAQLIKHLVKTHQ